MIREREFGEVVPQKFNYNGQKSTINVVSLYSVGCAQTKLQVSTKKKKRDHRNSTISAYNR
jgi:hypothetical protein